MSASDADLLARASAWIADDPDPATRAEVQALVDAASAPDAATHPDEPAAAPQDEGDAPPDRDAALADLADRFSAPLQFGTAGLRGRMGGGPNRMNRAVVIRAAAGIVAWLRDRPGATDGPRIVIGFDARHTSDVLALDTAAVVTAAGGTALVLPRPLPTPVLAFATRHLGADAGVMVTASHNPPQDNGYKVYLGDGSQIIAPVDAEIAAHIAAVPSVAATTRSTHGWVTLDDAVLEAYLETAVAVLDPDGPREVGTVHTALHGVGSPVLAAAFARAGFPAPDQVSSQAAPDPDFPTVLFPNPEEEGAMDAALDLARRHRPDLVIANDPDADRCALAVPDPADPAGYRMLRGDEVGALLGWYLVTTGRIRADRPVLARSIVSSRLLGRIAEAAGLEATETLTGFKWIGRVPRLGFGYEEALGYCVDPAHVPDKDGITAALLAAELAASLRAAGRTPLDVLDDLAREHGLHATDAFSVRVEELARIGRIMAALRDTPPEQLAGIPVTERVDLAAGWAGLPPTDGVRYLLADDTRVIVRPSGTEPKLKVYLEVVVPVPGDAATSAPARAAAAARLAEVTAAMRALTDVP